MGIQEEIERLENYKDFLDSATKELQEKRAVVEEWNKGCLIATATGATTGAFGGLLAVAGVLAAPFTGGASLAVAAGGLATGLAGGATSGASEITTAAKKGCV